MKFQPHVIINCRKRGIRAHCVFSLFLPCHMLHLQGDLVSMTYPAPALSDPQEQFILLGTFVLEAIVTPLHS